MESYEVLERAIDEVGAKRVSSDLGVSLSLVYKWCQPPKDVARPDASGARNPLDRIAKLMETAENRAPLDWLCARQGGFFCESPEVVAVEFDKSFVARTQKIIEEFSGVLGVMSASMADDGRVDGEEAARIRESWQKLKSVGEAFVTACEGGHFDDSEG